jgi:hypothetical protein
MSTRALNTLQRLAENAKAGVEGIISEVTGALGGHAHGRGGTSGASNVSTTFPPSLSFMTYTR